MLRQCSALWCSDSKIVARGIGPWFWLSAREAKEANGFSRQITLNLRTQFIRNRAVTPTPRRIPRAVFMAGSSSEPRALLERWFSCCHSEVIFDHFRLRRTGIPLQSWSELFKYALLLVLLDQTDPLFTAWHDDDQSTLFRRDVFEICPLCSRTVSLGSSAVVVGSRCTVPVFKVPSIGKHSTSEAIS